MPFEPVEHALDLPALEARVLERWERDDVFAESLRRRAGAPRWVFYEGPPTANGRPGIHHVWARSFKDLFCRYRAMRGHLVERKAGWDCHGLPVEVEVEKELGFSGKPDIEAFGIAEFNARCRASVQRYVEAWADLTTRMGMWLDTDDAYWTLDRSYIESVWWLFRRMWDDGLVYEGSKVVPYCGRCGTALSSHELGQPGAYRDVTEPSVYVRFPVVGRDFDLLVWTTTPWTLVSNVAVAVGPDVDYVRVRSPEPGRRDLVLARARVEEVLGARAGVVGPVAAAELAGLRYERPFDALALGEHGARVVVDPFVTTGDGSGIVHLAPAFGEVDREVADREGLPTLNPVDAAARFDATVPTWQGRFVKDADPAIIDELARSGRLERVVDFTHAYPHCWRCGTPLVYWAKPTWFARTSARRADLLRENDTIGWHPEHVKHGRFGDWLEHNVDWALSRDRFWGTPIPVWRCEACGHDTCIGSVAELAAAAGQDLGDLDLHRPHVDDVAIACGACGGTARRVESVLDAWFDSGSMPTAQLHYPFEHADELGDRFPADFICEAIDQTRGWFYSLLAVNTLVLGRTPYRNVVCVALIMAGDGQKMSKSRGNIVDPWTIFEGQGADALRWNFFSSGSPWTTRRVSIEGIEESARRFLLTLWNTYAFFVTYATLDGWEPDTSPGSPPTSRPSHVLDRWMRSRLAATIEEVTAGLEGFDASRAAQALDALVDDVSNWYVRRSRSRFWRAAEPEAHATLHDCLATLARLLAPFCPFTADELWSNLAAGRGSVHLADWPRPRPADRDLALEEEMATARLLVSLGRAARTDAKVRVRQPLRRASVLAPGRPLPPPVIDEVARELNVKSVEVVSALDGLVDHVVKPNYRALGPRLGPRLPAVRAALDAADGGAVRRALDDAGAYAVELDGERIELGPDDLEVTATAHEELALARDGAVAVALDLRLDDELRTEGVARELVRALNEHRKAAGLEISDRITLRLHAGGAVGAAARAHGETIASEVLATSWEVLDAGTAPPLTVELAIAGERVGVEMQRA